MPLYLPVRAEVDELFPCATPLRCSVTDLIPLPCANYMGAECSPLLLHLRAACGDLLPLSKHSGRIPAMFNGCVGVKPTVGRLSTTGVVPACVSLDCVSVFAQTVEDAATVTRLARVRSLALTPTLTLRLRTPFDWKMQGSTTLRHECFLIQRWFMGSAAGGVREVATPSHALLLSSGGRRKRSELASRAAGAAQAASA